MKVLITGAQGQLGNCLADTAPSNVDLILTDVSELDLGNQDTLIGGLERIAPDLIINAGAYTAVDRAEQEPELAERINHLAVGWVADYCEAAECNLIHISSDYVFDGSKSTAYQPDDSANPLCVYGQTKLGGEIAALSRCSTSKLVRSSWAYSEYGNNFVKTMLELATTRDQISVVNDQTGSPTYSRNLARMIWKLAHESPEERIFHCSDAGQLSWFEFATAVFEEAQAIGLIASQPKLIPISSAEYNAPAVRPAFSPLDNQLTLATLGIEQQAWRDALRDMLQRLPVSYQRPAATGAM